MKRNSPFCMHKMTKMQALVQVQLPLAKKAVFAGIRLAIVSTIGIGTIAASINLQSSDITDPLISEKKTVLVPLASGLKIGTASEGVTVQSLLDTSDTSFSKVKGYDMSTAEKEDGDIDGKFSIAVSAEYSSGGKAVWIASDSFLDDQMIAYSSSANTDFVMNSMSWMTGDTSGVAIASKSLGATYLTINESQAAMIKLFMLVIAPLFFLAVGIDEVRMRRKKQ